MFPPRTHAPLRTPEGAAAGADPAAPPAAAPAAQPAGTTAPEADAPTIFDVAGTQAAPAAPAADGKPPRPAEIPEQFWDADKGEVRVAALGKSWSDLRTKVARGEGKIPDKPEAYALPEIEGVQVAELVKADDPLWTEVRTAAHAEGITEKQLQALVKPYLAAAAKQRGAEVTDPAAVKAAIVAARQEELAKLGANGQNIVQDIGAWIAGMENGGALTPAEARALKSVGTADGIRALTKLREAMGAPAIPTDALATDSMSEADARRLMKEGFAANDEAKITRAREALRALEKQGRLGNNRAA
jgi:hypothetical protein